MALRLSRATGNWLTAATWGTIDATSLVNSEAATGVVTTSYTASAGATTGVITATGIGLKLSVRTGTTGTLSAHLAIATVEVTGTLVTINTADLPVAATADINGGWFFLKFASPVVLAGATSYTVEVKTSSSSQISLFSTASTAWSHFICTNVATAPTTGDDVIVTGEYLSAGASNAFTVTIDETTTTDYGAAPTAAISLVQPGIAISAKGTLVSGTTAATAYRLKISNSVVVYSGGTLSLGTTGTPMPRDSSLYLNFDCGANVDYGLTVRNLGTFNAQGLSRSSGKNIVSCLLNTDEAVASTSLGISANTGWLDNDVVVVASTTRTSTQCEVGALNGNANAADITVDGFAGAGGGLAFAHSGTAPTQAEVILLTRNILISGASDTLQGYIDIKATAIIDWDWAEFKWLGSAVATRRGIDAATSAGTLNIQFCSFHDFVVAGAQGLAFSSTTGTWTVSDCVSYNIASNHVSVSSTSAWTLSNFVAMICTTGAASGGTLLLLNCSGTASNLTAVGAGARCVTFAAAAPASGSISNITAHSSNFEGIVLDLILGSAELTFTNLKSYRNSTAGLAPTRTLDGLLFNGLELFGNASAGINNPGGTWTDVTFYQAVMSGDTTFSCPYGINFGGVNGQGRLTNVRFLSSTFGVVSGIKTAHTTGDINFGTPSTGATPKSVTFTNCILASTTEFVGQSGWPFRSAVGLVNHDQTVGLHKTLRREGTLAIEATTVHTGAHSLSMTPIDAAVKLISGSRGNAFTVQVSNGATLTPSIYIQKSAAYNGNQPRLIVLRNDAIGIASDTVLSTYSAGTGSWNQISGTTAAATDDGVMEFIVDCDGTAGVVYVDSFACTPAVSTNEFNYWSDGLPFIVGELAGGGVGIIGG